MVGSRLGCFAALLFLSAQLLGQTTVGVVVGGDFSGRTIRAEEEGLDPIVDVVSDGSGFAFLPSVGVTFERQVTSLFALAVQLRYQQAGYNYEVGAPALDPRTGESVSFAYTESTVRYDFLSLPIGVSEQWGNGGWQFYAEEFLVPMLSIRTNQSFTVDPLLQLSPELVQDREVEEVNDFQLGVRVGLGVQRTFNDIFRVRVGLSGRYHFTLTENDSIFREHLFGFGPEVKIGRVFGYNSVQADDGYY